MTMIPSRANASKLYNCIKLSQTFLTSIDKINEATVKRFHYESHEQLRVHLANFMAAYNFARRLKTLCGLTPYEYIAESWTSEPHRFIVDRIHQMPGLNT